MALEGEKPATEQQQPAATSPAVEAKDAAPPKQDAPAKPQSSEDKYEIRLNTYTVVSALGVTAVHNEVAFYRNGEPLMALNGNAHDRKTGELSTFAVQPGNTLRVTATSQTYGDKGMQQVASVSLGTMSREEFLEKMRAATAASQYINNNNIDYVVVGGPHYEAQNSNSVATSLVTAMGYQYPATQLAQFWDPGSKRNLLPSNFSPSLSNDEMTTALNNMDRSSIMAQVQSERRPEPQASTPMDGVPNNFPTLHDPNAPKVAAAAPPEASSQTTSKSLPTTGFQSASESVIKVDQPLTQTFTNVAVAATPEPSASPDPAITQKMAQNASVYMANGTSGP